jgi:DNA-binding PadR family transcriptional regulator
MSEARLLPLVASYPHPNALARRAHDGALFAHLHRLEARGYVTRRREGYRITRRGRRELAMVMAIARLRP